jgi:hypothetical protein
MEPHSEQTKDIVTGQGTYKFFGNKNIDNAVNDSRVEVVNIRIFFKS